MAEPLPGTFCPFCGKQGIPDGPVCPSCGESLLVTVALEQAVADPRARHEAARAVAALGPPAPSFDRAQLLMAKAGATLAERVSREFAARLVGALLPLGVRTRVVSRKRSDPRPGGSRLLASSIALVLILLGSAALWRVSREHQRAQAKAAAEAEAARAVPLTTQQIAKRTLPAVASVTCKDGVGSAFFIEPEVALTNAHVACPLGESQEVLLRDGRTLSGVTLWRDDWLDLARVKVVGANARPLVVGDATALVPGDPVVFVGSPRGLEFTLHEGKISFVGRPYLGLGYLQLNGTVNPGNSGGPVLDAFGRVVGVVSLKVTDAEGIGLALPIQYAIEPRATPDAGTPEEQRWSELLARVQEDNERELSKAKKAAALHPMFLGVAEGKDEVPVGLFIEHWPKSPRATPYRLLVESGARHQCTLSVTTRRWDALATASSSAKNQRRAQWLVRYGAAKDLFVAQGPLELGTCEGFQSAGPSSISDRDGQASGGEIEVQPEQLDALISRLQELAHERGEEPELVPLE